MTSMHGRVALVTGGGRGIGRATALELARRGADVAVAARNAGEIEEVAAAIRAQGRRTLAVPVDLSDAQATRGLAATVEQALGPVAILVNNAGVVGPFGASWELDPLEWKRALQINLVAPFVLSHALLPGMVAYGVWQLLASHLLRIGRRGFLAVVAWLFGLTSIALQWLGGQFFGLAGASLGLSVAYVLASGTVLIAFVQLSGRSIRELIPAPADLAFYQNILARLGKNLPYWEMRT